MLCHSHIEKRSKSSQKNSVKLALNTIGYVHVEKLQDNLKNEKKRGPCYFCSQESKRRKIFQKCTDCSNNVCNEHFIKLTKVMCHKCKIQIEQ